MDDDDDGFLGSLRSLNINMLMFPREDRNPLFGHTQIVSVRYTQETVLHKLLGLLANNDSGPKIRHSTPNRLVITSSSLSFFWPTSGVSQDIGVALGEFLSVGIWVCPEIKPPPTPDEIVDSSSQSLTFDSYSNSEP